jgi:predicted ATP-grasp superfamily ATP-dependent carboligase
LIQLGHVLAARAGLSWLWGVDFIWNSAGLHVLEVNPRMTAALEVLEHAMGSALCVDDPGLPRRVVGKAVVYAPWNLKIGPNPDWEEAVAMATNVWRLPVVADIPHDGEQILQGQPVVTRFAEGYSVPEVKGKLLHLAEGMTPMFETWRLP